MFIYIHNFHCTMLKKKSVVMTTTIMASTSHSPVQLQRSILSLVGSWAGLQPLHTYKGTKAVSVRTTRYSCSVMLTTHPCLGGTLSLLFPPTCMPGQQHNIISIWVLLLPAWGHIQPFHWRPITQDSILNREPGGYTNQPTGPGSSWPS